MATKRLQVYMCERCGNVVEVLHTGGGQLICCGQPMDQLEEQTADPSTEKHVPVVEKVDEGYKVKVGNVPHPMAEKHQIEWIELIADDEVHRRYLAPGDPPEAVFAVQADQVTAREQCNIHGLWKS